MFSLCVLRETPEAGGVFMTRSFISAMMLSVEGGIKETKGERDRSRRISLIFNSAGRIFANMRAASVEVDLKHLAMLMANGRWAFLS